jgi:N-acyl-D-amino-acid deacylase
VVRSSVFAAFLGLGCASVPEVESRGELDVLFTNGIVVDGSGSERYEADVGIAGDSIQVIGQDLEERYDAERVIDLAGKIIAPGYIDIHSHTDRTSMGDDPEMKAALNLLYQGITTVSLGADGRHSRKYADQKEGQISRQLDFIDANGFGMNVFALLGHGSIRRAVMGEDFMRFTTEAEMREMGTYVQRYMEEGAMGMTFGLEYEPGRFSDEEELVYLAKIMGDYDNRAVIIAHERATGLQHRYYLPSDHDAEGLYGDRFRKYPDGWSVIDYVREGISIAEQADVVYDFTHFKITHESNWGRSAEVIDLVEAARDRGVRIYAEHMPTTNSGNSPMNLDIIPEKYYEDSGDSSFPYSSLERVLSDRVEGERLRADIAWQIDKHGGGTSVDIIDTESHPEWIGKSLNELSQEWGLPDLVDVVLRVKQEGDADLLNGARFRSFQTLSLVDVGNLASTDWVGTVTDGGVTPLEGGFAQPRLFASFTTKITLLVKENGIISLEHAIRAGTSLPATMLSIPDRGLIRPGYKADIQVFDLDELEVMARWTLTDSRAYSEGVYYVLLNGAFVLDDKTPTYTLAGTSIRNQRAWDR